jgi:cell division initiation protein
MKITPIDIQQMVFQVKFRGYDRDEVNRFLEELALTVENLNRENSALREKLTATEQQVTDLRRTETTLSNTLVSAQTLAEDVKRSAQRESDLIVKEAELKASEIIRQARVSLSEMQRGLADLQKQRSDDGGAIPFDPALVRTYVGSGRKRRVSVGCGFGRREVNRRIKHGALSILHSLGRPSPPASGGYQGGSALPFSLHLSCASHVARIHGHNKSPSGCPTGSRRRRRLSRRGVGCPIARNVDL